MKKLPPGGRCLLTRTGCWEPHRQESETIDNDSASGAVYVDGKTWTARSADGSVLPAGSRVEIRRMEGVKLIVEAAQKAPDKKRGGCVNMMDVLKWVPLLILVVLLLILLIGNIVIVQQSKAYVVERLGAFRTVWGVGLHLKGALYGAGGQEGDP